MTNHITLSNLGWQPYFQQQLTLDEWDVVRPARIVEQHQSSIEMLTEKDNLTLPISYSMPQFTVGDWILLDSGNQFLRVLYRKSCFRRKAAGSKISEQLIAANVDTAFIVCSLNDDFNLNRIERYLSLVNEAGAEPVVILSKVDLCANADSLLEKVQQLNPLLCIVMLNCLENTSSNILIPWCQPGKTIVLLGSSGAGKSSLSNTLMGASHQLTADIRLNDAKGRHTTTRRSLLSLPDGAMILDTPGMRELQLANCETGVTRTFSDIVDLAKTCRFADCQHNNEPDCAVRAALTSGALDQRRFLNYTKLLREQAYNGANPAERRQNDKSLSRHHKHVIRESKKINRH